MQTLIYSNEQCVCQTAAVQLICRLKNESSVSSRARDFSFASAKNVSKSLHIIMLFKNCFCRRGFSFSVAQPEWRNIWLPHQATYAAKKRILVVRSRLLVARGKRTTNNIERCWGLISGSLYPGAYIRELITGGLYLGHISPGAYNRVLISGGLYPRGLYIYAVNKKGVSCRKQGVSWTNIAFLFKCS